MLRKTIFTCATAVALGFAASAASTAASAASAKGGFRTATVQGKTVGHGNVHIGKVSLVRPGGRRTRCREAECGGNTVAIDGIYVFR
jgi:hypothetical protein